MRRFLFSLFLTAGICVAAGGKAYASEDPLTSDSLLSVLYDSVDAVAADEEAASVSGNDLSSGVLPDIWDVMYYDSVDPDGNPYTSKYTKFLDGKTLYISEETFPGGLAAPAAVYDTYYGVIPSNYLELFRGLAVKLGFKEHYVCARTGQYDYIFAHGDDLSLSGNVFTGSGVDVYTYHTNNNGYFTLQHQGSFTLNGNSYVVYSDLGSNYPSLLDSSDVYVRVVFLLLGIVVIGYFINSFFGKGIVTNNLRKSKKREVY